MSVEDILYRLWKTAEFDYDDLQTKRAQLDVFRSIEWYVRTDRAPLIWVKALAKADPKKIIQHAMRCENRSIEGQIKAVTDYLQRYCQKGLKKSEKVGF